MTNSMDSRPDILRQRVLDMLDEQPGIRYALAVDNPDSDPVIVALAIRGVATCELAIPAFDPFAFLEFVERHGGASG